MSLSRSGKNQKTVLRPEEVKKIGDPLADSDLVIVIVDNKDGITQATMNEINRAKALKKKCIYIFCDQREKNITELQAQLQEDTSNPRISIIQIQTVK